MYDERLPRLILADGTILEDSECGYTEHELFCWVKHKEMSEVFSIFSDPEKTKIIRHRYGGHNYGLIYKDFKELIQIRKCEDYIEARLAGGNKGEPEPGT